MPLSRVLPVVFCLAFVPLPGAAAETTEALVGRVIATYGGADALSRFAVMRQTGRTVSARRSGAVGALIRLFQRPDKLRVEIAYPGETPEIRLLDGERGWRRSAEVSGPLYGAMVLQAARLALPLLLLDELARLEDLGMQADPQGGQFRLLRLQLRDDLALFVTVDVETGHIRSSRGVMLAGGRPAIEFTTIYSGLQNWDGILVATREEQFVMGQSTGHTIIDRVEFQESVDTGEFHP